MTPGVQLSQLSRGAERRRGGALARVARAFSAIAGVSSAPARRVRTWAAAAGGNMLGAWASALLSPNKELEGAGPKLRGRARELRRNNPHVARYAGLCVENILGPDGLTLQAGVPSTRGTNAALSAACEATFYEWAETAGVDGRDWWGVCSVLVETWRTEGEIGLELVLDESLPFGVGVQLVDADLIDDRFNVRDAGDGDAVVAGVRVSRTGRPVGYYVLERHPSEGGYIPRRYVPASRLFLLSHRPRAGQIRGVTPLAPAMIRLHMLGGAQESLAMLLRVAATKMGFIERTKDADDDETDAPATTWDAVPGAIERLDVGDTFKGWDPGQPTAEYDPFSKSLLREIAAALGVSYVALTGDVSDTSYSSARVGLLAERDSWRVLQRVFATVICAPVYREVIRAARMSGRLYVPAGIDPATLAASEWHGRSWDWVDPSKDVAAIGDAIDRGLTTVTRELAKRGLGIREVLEERAAELALAKSLGVELTPPKPPAALPAPKKPDA